MHDTLAYLIQLLAQGIELAIENLLYRSQTAALQLLDAGLATADATFGMGPTTNGGNNFIAILFMSLGAGVVVWSLRRLR
jgi:hypothetical protein